MEEIKVTWRLAWGLWWRMALIGLGVSFIIWLILFLMFLVIGVAFMPFMGGF